MGKIIFGVILFIPFVAWGGTRIVKDINFDRHCQGFMKQSADANTISIAKKSLSTALDYLDDEQLFRDGVETHYTSVIYNSPGEDVGFWCGNLRAAMDELNNFDEESADVLIISNFLMKLRETLTDDAGSGVSVTVPTGMSVYPNNTAYAVSGLFAFMFGCVGTLLIMVGISEGSRW